MFKVAQVCDLKWQDTCERDRRQKIKSQLSVRLDVIDGLVLLDGLDGRVVGVVMLQRPIKQKLFSKHVLAQLTGDLNNVQLGIPILDHFVMYSGDLNSEHVWISKNQ